jgi:hypothetical protein
MYFWDDNKKIKEDDNCDSGNDSGDVDLNIQMNATKPKKQPQSPT